MQAAELMPVELTVEPWAANKGIEGEAFDNVKLCSGAPTGAGVGKT